MSPANGATGTPVGDSELVHAIAERVLAASGPVPVEDDRGNVIGSLDREAVTRVLLDKDRNE